MPSEWRETTLGAVARLESGGTPSKANPDFWRGSIPWVSAKDLGPTRLADAQEHISSEGLRLGSQLAPADSTLLLVRGMTLLTDVPVALAQRELAFNQDIKAIVPSAEVDGQFLFYSLLATKPALRSAVELAGHGTGRIPTDRLESLALCVPPLATQRVVARILGALDDKIELNRKMNETLEQMARAIFKSWFIDFDPVRRNMARRSGQIQPSSPALLPAGEGRRQYRGGYDFAGLVERARELRKKQTPAEAVLWEMLRNRRFLGLKFRRQHQLGDYVVDLYCDEWKLAVELDGPIHDTDSRRKHDAKRDAYMESLGVTVRRFKNARVIEDPESVLADIAAAGPSPVGRGGGGGGVAGIDALFPDALVDSPLGKIPKGWAVKTVEDIAEVVGGSTPSTVDSAFWNQGKHHWATPKDLAALDVPVLLDTERKITDAGVAQISSGLLPAGTVLLSSRAPIGYLAIAEIPVAINQGFIAMLPRKGMFNLFLLHWARNNREEIAGRANGTTFLEISKGNFRPIPVAVPPPDVLGAFDAHARPLYRRVVASTRESRTLAAIRDALLPKLMSGEVRVEGH